MEPFEEKGFAAKNWSLGQLNALVKNLGELEARDIQSGRPHKVDICPMGKSRPFAKVPEQRVFDPMAKMNSDSARKKFNCRITESHFGETETEMGESKIFVSEVDRGCDREKLFGWLPNERDVALRFSQLYYLLSNHMLCRGEARNKSHFFLVRTPYHITIPVRVLFFGDIGLTVDEISLSHHDPLHGGALIFTGVPIY